MTLEALLNYRDILIEINTKKLTYLKIQQYELASMEREKETEVLNLLDLKYYDYLPELNSRIKTLIVEKRKKIAEFYSICDDTK